MNQTTSDINVNLADECKRLRACVNQLEGILEHSESENGALRARVDRLEAAVKAHEMSASASEYALKCAHEVISTAQRRLKAAQWGIAPDGMPPTDEQIHRVMKLLGEIIRDCEIPRAEGIAPPLFK